MSYEPRRYRRLATPPGLVAIEVVVGETDLLIHAERDLSEIARELVVEARAGIASYIARVPRFAETFVPLPVGDDVPGIVRVMAQAARTASVGPMAAVAGAVAEFVARGLADVSPNVIVENGGDIYLMGSAERIVSVWAGEEGATGLGVRLAASQMPIAVATSSGTIGPSISLGSADTATVLAASGALADAAASAVGNRVHSAGDLAAALDVAKGIEGVIGAVVTVQGAVGACGAIELVPVAAGGPSAG